jgi:hypothetical protein
MRNSKQMNFLLIKLCYVCVEDKEIELAHSMMQTPSCVILA